MVPNKSPETGLNQEGKNIFLARLCCHCWGLNYEIINHLPLNHLNYVWCFLCIFSSNFQPIYSNLNPEKALNQVKAAKDPHPIKPWGPASCASWPQGREHPFSFLLFRLTWISSPPPEVLTFLLPCRASKLQLACDLSQWHLLS